MKDKTHESFDPLLQKVKLELDESVDHLDAETLSALRQRRERVLSDGVVRKPWYAAPAMGMMATASVALVVGVMWLGGDSPAMNTMVVEDIELLSSAESIELYEEYEFYQWLDDEDLAS